MMAPNPTFFHHLDFVVRGTTPEQILAFQFPSETQARIHGLMDRHASGEILSSEEKLEVEQFLDIEHVLVILKARASQVIQAR